MASPTLAQDDRHQKRGTPSGGAKSVLALPFQNYKTFCPYLVGTYDEVAELVAGYIRLGARTFILDIPCLWGRTPAQRHRPPSGSWGRSMSPSCSTTPPESRAATLQDRNRDGAERMTYGDSRQRATDSRTCSSRRDAGRATGSVCSWRNHRRRSWPCTPSSRRARPTCRSTWRVRRRGLPGSSRLPNLGTCWPRRRRHRPSRNWSPAAGCTYRWDYWTRRPMTISAGPPRSAPATGVPCRPSRSSPWAIQSRLLICCSHPAPLGCPRGSPSPTPTLTAFLDWAVGYFGFRPSERHSGHPPLHFRFVDVRHLRHAGHGRCAVSGAAVAGDRSNRLAAFIRTSELTQWFSVPSVLTYMAKFDAVAQGDFPALERLLWCGETLPTPILAHWMRRLPHVQFTNLYGPTEATIASSYYTVEGCPSDETQTDSDRSAVWRRATARARRRAASGAAGRDRRDLHRRRRTEPRLLAR